MNWLFYTLLSLITSAFIGILQKVLMNKEESNPVFRSFVLQILGALVCFIFALIKDFTMPPILQYPLNFVLMAILYALCTLFSFKALKTIEASKMAVIFCFGSVVAIFSSAIFLKETITSTIIWGTILIILSIVIATKPGDFSLKSPGVLYSLAAAGLGGLAIVNDAYLLKFSDAVSYTALGFFLPAIPLLLIYPKIIVDLKKIPKLISPFDFLLALTWGISAIAFYLALEKGGLVSQISPISQTKIILTILFSAILLKEKQRLAAKLTAGILAAIGVILIS